MTALCNDKTNEIQLKTSQFLLQNKQLNKEKDDLNIQLKKSQEDLNSQMKKSNEVIISNSQIFKIKTQHFIIILKEKKSLFEKCGDLERTVKSLNEKIK